MFKKNFKGFLAGMLAMALLTAAAGVFASRSETISAVYNNIKIAIDGVLLEPKDVNGVEIEPFIHNGTTYLPVRAIGEAFRKEVNWDSESVTVFIGEWAEKPYREVAIWNKPYLEVSDSNQYHTSEKSGIDYLNFTYPRNNTSYIIYPVNGMAKEIKGTFLINDVWDSAQIKINFYDENNNTLYNSPILTKSTQRTDFRFNIGSILQIKIEVIAINNANGTVQIENFRLISKDY